MRVILVGHGYFGSLYRQRIQDNTNYKLVGVCDPDYKRLASLTGTTVAEKYESLADNVEHDAVIVCTPPHLHADVSIEALMRKKNVLCMKPGVMSEKDLTMINALAHKDNLVFLIDYTMMWAQENAYLDRQFYWIGRPEKISSNRLVVGAPKPEGPVWDLLPHDVATYHTHCCAPYGIDLITSVSCNSDGISATARLISDEKDVAYFIASYNATHPMKTTRFDVYPDKQVVTNPRFMITWDQNKRSIMTESQGGTLGVYFSGHPDPITLALNKFIREVGDVEWYAPSYIERQDWVTRILTAFHHSSENDGAIVRITK